jgi:hypothetical protein
MDEIGVDATCKLRGRDSPRAETVRNLRQLKTLAERRERPLKEAAAERLIETARNRARNTGRGLPELMTVPAVARLALQ